MTLEERFKKFLSGLANAEDIDSIPLPADMKGNSIADYFLNNREVIVEIKTLKEDAAHKIEETLASHKERDEFPIFYGQMRLDKVLASLPDGEAINEQIHGRITRSIQKAFKKANEQILSTRISFNTPNSVGILAILNEDLDVFSPDTVTAKVSELLTRKNDDNSYCYEHIACVLIINESHFVKLDNGMDALPITIITGPCADIYPALDSYMDFMLRAWAAFNGMPLFMDAISDYRGIEFQSHREKEQSQATMIPRHEHWRKEYRSNPYLRELSKENLIKYGRELIAETASQMMVGSKGFDIGKFEQFTHFLEESNYRGIDVRELQLQTLKI